MTTHPLHRTTRLIMVVAALAAYVGFCWALVERDLVMGSAAAFWQLMGIWATGLLMLLVVHQRSQQVTLARAVWLNVGVVILALLVPHALRFLMLVPTLFGVMYAALTLSRRQVWFVSFVTFAVYVVGEAALMNLAEVDATFELASLAGFAAMLTGVNFLGDEVFALRRAFHLRRRRLDEALARLEELAVRDELTGVYNRRYINEVLARQKALADRGQIDFSVCFCDLDHFKMINDAHGHGCGDEMLRNFAGLAEETVRSVDFVARWGGDEFLLVLIGARDEVAERVTNRLREHTVKLGVPGGRSNQPVSVSIGVAQFRRGERVEQLLARADRALYDAKGLGRNRVVVAGRSPAESVARIPAALG